LFHNKQSETLASTINHTSPKIALHVNGTVNPKDLSIIFRNAYKIHAYMYIGEQIRYE